jgi:NAD(P)H-hydrate epimerase
MGQGLSNFDATVLGVYIHGLAGDIAAEKVGQVSLIATDIIDALGEAFLRR